MGKLVMREASNLVQERFSLGGGELDDSGGR